MPSAVQRKSASAPNRATTRGSPKRSPGARASRGPVGATSASNVEAAGAQRWASRSRAMRRRLMARPTATSAARLNRTGSRGDPGGWFSGGCLGRLQTLMVGGLELGRRDVAAGGVEAAGGPEVDPPPGRQLDLLDAPPGAAVDELGLVEAVDALGEGVVVAVAPRPDRGDCLDLSEPLGVA